MPFFPSVQLPHPPSGRDVEEAPQAWPWQRVLLVVVLLVALLLAVLSWGRISERQAVERMNPQERAILFNQTWQSFQLLCQEQADPGLTSRCGDQARFLKEFPECKDDCLQKIDSFKNRPSR